jgi:hypothetical protein
MLVTDWYSTPVVLSYECWVDNMIASVPLVEDSVQVMLADRQKWGE